VAIASSFIIDNDILTAFEKGENVDVFIHGPQFSNHGLFKQKNLTRSERRVLTRKVYGEFNQEFQTPLIAALREHGISFRSFWITNSVLVFSATPQLLEIVKKFPNVVELEADKITAFASAMIHSVENIPKQEKRLEWNINLIGAPSVWANVTQGEGVTLSNIDTGVRYTHVAVVDSYRGNLGSGQFNHDYHWFDPRGQQVPFDNNGHGTHTMGTIAGSEASGIGVAPGSKWIAAKGCASSSCATADLIASAEWVICPTRQGGAGEDCTQGADVVSNSWGGGQGSTTFLTVIQAWVDAGSVPVFSQGNAGPTCGSANSPGDLAIVIGVGSTDSKDALSSFSSRGPAVNRPPNFIPQKPDVSAPGSSVRSSYHTSDTAYASLSGTSMAAPHVTGLIGLILSANPSLDYDTIRTILEETSTLDLNPPTGQTTCSGVSWDVKPNYHYGYGRIDAVAAVNAS